MDTTDHRSEQFDATVSRVPDRSVVDVTFYAPAELHLIDVIGKYVDSISQVVGAAPSGIEIVREDEWQRRAAAPTMPELMSAAEISDELGVARQRVHQLRSTAAFPAPLAELRGGAVWMLRQCASSLENGNGSRAVRPGEPAAERANLKSGQSVDRTHIEDSHGIVLTQADLNRMSSEEVRMLGESAMVSAGVSHRCHVSNSCHAGAGIRR